jgi:molecular chaperone DnaK (HSP70)
LVACGKPFRTVRDYQTEIKIMVYQGDRPRAEDNYLLGEFKLTGITPAKAG